MRGQREREEQSVLIGAALGVFVVVLGVELVALWLVHSTFSLDVGNAVGGCAVVIAGACAVATLVRSERS